MVLTLKNVCNGDIEVVKKLPFHDRTGDHDAARAEQDVGGGCGEEARVSERTVDTHGLFRMSNESCRNRTPYLPTVRPAGGYCATIGLLEVDFKSYATHRGDHLTAHTRDFRQCTHQ
jgi:hypothetical protein